MTPTQAEQYAEIRRLLRDAYDHYFAHSDGYCKSAEGAVEVYYPNYFDEKNGADPHEAAGLMIYSYVFGPHRRHHYLKADKSRRWGEDVWAPDPFATALEDVRRWHADEMATVYERD